MNKRKRMFLLLLPAGLLALYLAPQTPVEQGLRFETAAGATEVRVEVARSATPHLPDRSARLSVVGTVARYDFRAPKDDYVITAEALGAASAEASMTRTMKLEGHPVKLALVPAKRDEGPAR